MVKLELTIYEGGVQTGMASIAESHANACPHCLLTPHLYSDTSMTLAVTDSHSFHSFLLRKATRAELRDLTDSTWGHTVHDDGATHVAIYP